jgi:P-type Mg2+ transporter
MFKYSRRARASVDRPQAPAAFWSNSVDEVFSALGSGRDGLSPAEAKRRATVFGPNVIADEQQSTVLQLLIRQFESPLVLILIIGAVISMALGEWIDASIILAVIAGSTFLGFAQEYRASAAIAQLKHRLALTSTVIRQGNPIEIAMKDIVPGDIVLLTAGDLTPGDGLLVEARDFLVSEASLTGETFPVEKRPGTTAAHAPLGARTNAVFLGTSVRSGTARVLIVVTGSRTEFGAIAQRLGVAPEETEFARGVRQFGAMLLRVMLFMVLFVLLVNALLGRPFVESLLFSVALAVGLSPELLPAIVSITLSRGAQRMAKRGVIVRRLEAIENLGSIDVLCTDKTGTLTTGQIELEQTLDPSGQVSNRVRMLAYLNSQFETGIDNPLDGAVIAACERHHLSTEGYSKVDEVPYDFLRKRLTILVAERGVDDQHLMISKGAFDNVLSICTTVVNEHGGEALTMPARARLKAIYEAQGKQGYRVLAVATRMLPAGTALTHAAEEGACFAGFLIFSDPPKPDARATIEDLGRLGITVKVITGDNRHVAAHIASALGITGEILTGQEIAALKPEALWQRVVKTSLFAEIDPQQKEQIIRALQRNGHAVGYLGDGINDAPALHAADVGISVDQAVDVARESADVVLLRRDLGVLRQGVEDGRSTFANTIKYINITTSANFGNMISMAIASPFLPFLPLLPKQILLNNFLSDVPSMAISTDNVDAESVSRPQRWSVKAVERFMIVFGLASSVFDLLTFAALIFIIHAGPALFQTVWFVVSLLTELSVVLVLRTKGPSMASRPSSLLAWMTAGAIAICLVLPYLPPLARPFGFQAPSAPTLFAAVLIVVGYVLASECVKRRFFAVQR